MHLQAQQLCPTAKLTNCQFYNFTDLLIPASPYVGSPPPSPPPSRLPPPPTPPPPVPPPRRQESLFATPCGAHHHHHHHLPHSTGRRIRHRHKQLLPRHAGSDDMSRRRRIELLLIRRGRGGLWGAWPMPLLPPEVLGKKKKIKKVKKSTWEKTPAMFALV